MIELMIVVAVVAILGAVAYPSYVEHVNKSGRAEAHANLLKAADAQERYYLSNNEYGSMGQIGVPPLTTSDNYEYRVQRRNSRQEYTLRAIARAGQADDGDCPIIYLAHTGERTPTDCW